METYSIYFKGYWIGTYLSEITEDSGVYIVYRSICDTLRREVVLKELLYIGQAKNLRKRISEHNSNGDYLNECREGEVLCYSIAEVSEPNLNIVENALIFAQKPRLNTNLKDNYNYTTPVEFQIKGRCALMKFRSFTISEK